MAVRIAYGMIINELAGGQLKLIAKLSVNIIGVAESLFWELGDRRIKRHVYREELPSRNVVICKGHISVIEYSCIARS